MPFLLVDRITSLDPGRAARGHFVVPAGMDEFPTFLLVEAVGQLASWVTMAHLDFKLRPVAALAGEVLPLGEARSGDSIDLAVQLEKIERGGVVYGGTAAAGERPLLRLSRCVGPLLPMEDFDDPESVRARFAELRGAGIGGRRLDPGPPPHYEIIEEEPGERLRVSMQVPRQADFFAEHFPRRAVYPATMLLDRKVHVARRLLQQPGREIRLQRATHVKIGAFIFPGDSLEIEAQKLKGEGDEVSVQLTGYRDGTRVSRVRAEFLRSPA